MRSFAILPILAALLGGCPSAPKYRVSALVKIAGHGDAWENAREAARAVKLVQNLRRLVREVKRYQIPSLDTEDPIRVLQEMIVSRRLPDGQVRVRFYGDSRWELLRLCRGLLNLWESEGLYGILGTSGVAGERGPVRSEAEKAEDTAAGRARADAEEEVRRFSAEKQRLLAEQVDLGRRWQDATGPIAEREAALLRARKDHADAEADLRRLHDRLRRPLAERYRLLGDADVLRLQAEVVEAEGALRRASDLPAEVQARVRDVLERKKQALELAQRRLERDAAARVADARERLTAAEAAFAAVRREREETRARRLALSTRLADIERQGAIVSQRARVLSDRPPPRRSRPGPEIKVYRAVDVLRRCRAHRLEE